MKPQRIRRSQNSETWRVPDGTSFYYIKIVFDEDLDAVVIYRSYHKDPWISDGERYDSFAAARVSQGLPESEKEEMTPEEANKVARHHLGETLTSIMRGGPHGDDWIVFARHDATEASARAATVAEAAAEAAAQLRAAGWTPSHARLEWRSNGWQHYLHLCIDRLSPELLFAAQFQDGAWNVFNRTNDAAPCILRRGTTETAAATVAAWHAANLPSLHLPPFPGASQ
jgi:hypothetical protein